MQIPIPLRSNPGAWKSQGEARLFNCYAQFEGPEAKAASALISCPGQKDFGNLADGHSRGMIFVEEDDVGYVANGFHLQKLAEDGTVTELTIIPGDDPVYFTRNDAEPPITLMSTNTLVYVIKEGAANYKSYDFTPQGVTFCGGRFVFWETGGKIWYSDINTENVDGLSFFEAEGDPDGMTKAHGSINTLYLFGKKTTEIYSVSADQDAPFTRVGGAHLRIGSNSPHSIKDFNNGVAFVGDDNQVYFISGFNYQPFSSNEVTKLIAAEEDKTKVTATVYTVNQNKFYCLHGTGWTREYNATTQSWHDRNTLGQDDWESIHYMEAWGKGIFGSRRSGRFSEIDPELRTENGTEIVFGFQTPIIHAAPNGIQFEILDIDVDTGTATIDQREPMMMVDWSDDGARTWSNERFVSLGVLGEYKRRARVYGLGQTDEKGRTFRVRISDDIVRGVSSIYPEASPVPLR